MPAQAQTSAPAAATTATAPHAKLGTWGVDLTTRDLTVKPGEDFQKYSSGTWLKNTQIAADKPEASSFYELFDLSQEQLKDLVTNAAAGSKYGALYRSMMDEAGVEARGLRPLKADLAKSTPSRAADAARFMGATDMASASRFSEWACAPTRRTRAMIRSTSLRPGSDFPTATII